MDTFVKDLTDDMDLDALMTRVREVALGTGAAHGAVVPAQAPHDTAGHESDFVRLIETQSEWNEHTRKALAELVECLRTLRDDWAEAQKGLRNEIGQLSVLVRRLRRTPGGAVQRRKPAAAVRGRGTSASNRASRLRPTAKAGRRRS